MLSVRTPCRRRCATLPVASLPIPPSLHVEALLLGEAGPTVLASSKAADVRCPLCGPRSDRVHSRYGRTFADLPWARLAVRLRVRVRKFVCDDPACPRQVFAERLPGIAEAYARRTDRQREALTAIAFAEGGEAGARLAGALGYLVSPDPLLRLIRRDPEAEVPAPTVLGVDDWAIHKGLTSYSRWRWPRRRRPPTPSSRPGRSPG